MGKRRYSIEFKKEAVQLMILDGLSGREVSTKLGVNTNLLYRWKRLCLGDPQGDAASKQQSSSPKEMAAEIDRLRKELRRSERINQILKKTVGYFAKDEQ